MTYLGAHNDPGDMQITVQKGRTKFSYSLTRADVFNELEMRHILRELLARLISTTRGPVTLDDVVTMRTRARAENRSVKLTYRQAHLIRKIMEEADYPPYFNAENKFNTEAAVSIEYTNDIKETDPYILGWYD